MILGKGYNSNPRDCPRAINGEVVISHTIWVNMLIRSYSESEHLRYPRYRGCEVVEEWLDYCNFKDWFDKYDHKEVNYHLDKDLLFKGNKIYSPDTCVFLPPALNTLLIQSNSIRGELPIGVTVDKRSGKYGASCKIGNRKKSWLGTYENPISAFNAYKSFKENYVKTQANDWILEGKTLDPKAYEALMRYEILITD